jgi:signal transduction histidine kinase
MDDDMVRPESAPSPTPTAGWTDELPSDVEALKRAVRARERAVAVVAHDLRNPLGVIAQAGSTLLNRLSDPYDRKLVQRILDVTQRSRELVNDLLDVAAIEQGSFSIEKKPLDLSAVVLSITGSQRALARQNSIVMSADVAPELPEVQADERRIHNVLENLIGNALKFTASGGSITLGTAVRQEEVVVWVRDTGSGIAEADVPHVFDRYFHARRANRRGMGLGLSICKSIVEAHGGRIWIDSAVGEGTTVSFTLPTRAPTALP